MKRRWPLVAAVLLSGALGYAWWTARPVRPPLSPALGAHLVPRNLVPGESFVDPPPAGMTCEIYGVPMSYERVVQTMEAERGWRTAKLRAGWEFSKASFVMTEGVPFQVDVAPGRIAVVDVKTVQGMSDESLSRQSVVMVAVPGETSISRRFLAWVERLMGRGTAPTPVDTNVIYFRIDPPGTPSLP
ncbi:MAG: hypothetical protein ACO1SV_14780 [Fimbriimonas sp.]